MFEWRQTKNERKYRNSEKRLKQTKTETERDAAETELYRTENHANI